MRRVKVTYPSVTFIIGTQPAIREEGEVMLGWLHGCLVANPAHYIVEDDSGYVHVVAASIVADVPLLELG